MKQLNELFDLKRKPSNQLMVYCGLIFFIANFLGLIASVIVVASWSLYANRFLGVTQGLAFVSGLGLFVGFLKWRGSIREVQRQLSEKFAKYSTLILTGDELWMLLGLSASVAGLLLTLVLPFGFLLLLAGLVLLEHQLLSAMKSLEAEEQKFFSENDVQLSTCLSKTYDASYLIYSLVTLYGHSFVRMQENLDALECYLKARQDILGR
ncbi:MAG: hypothetical protein H5T93_08280 [Pseudothermotoga sp.]|uniref:hypothetical protein n=1 Tax=Pseudothermotoga sp. TaxID=2033661 RepID=UPI000A7D6995|nr:hypothetical protein [Pseudothermotoga sp.]HBT39886.1 hypothetical protein [Pseudothermotoga sp.]HCO97465.1 hypothetical protein [Pseudothermotoga sp.]